MTGTCSVDGCDLNVVCKGMCNKHIMQIYNAKRKLKNAGIRYERYKEGWTPSDGLDWPTVEEIKRRSKLMYETDSYMSILDKEIQDAVLGLRHGI